MKKTQTTTAKNIENKTTVLNLQKFAEQLKNVKISETKVKDKIYIYPETVKTEKEQKQFRSKMRNIVRRFTNNILVFAQTKQDEKLKNEIASFTKFYKENYRVNDFAISSISSAKDEKTKDIILMLEIIKSVQTQTKK